MMVSFTSQISFVLLFLLFATSFNSSICSRNRAVRCNENDRRLLLIFKQGVVDPKNWLSSWTSEEDCCSWEGVQCDNITGRVTELDLPSSELQGEISLCLLQLEFLSHLDMNHNNFTTVSIQPCQVSKSPTDKHRCNNQTFASPCNQSAKFSAPLRYLDFSYNYYLHITDLHWLSQLSSLKYLNLSTNDIGSETKWLHYLAMLPSLSELQLYLCGLRDFPPLNYVNFTSLVVLDLSRNNIKSELPHSFFNFTNDISDLELSYNSFHGQVPITLFKLRTLEHLLLGNNQLTGSMPSCLGNLSSIISLDLSNNHFSGNLSEKNFARLSNLKYLDLSSTGFKFHFDPKWAPPFQLVNIYMRNTSLGPNVPMWLYNQRFLENLDISRSGISTIDADVFWSFVAGIDDYVDLSNNSISGDISNVTLYTYSIHLGYNNLTGGLPRISTNVNFFYASHNSFSGSILPLCYPESNGENNLYNLDISYNHLSGALPECWANWKQLLYLDLGSNMLTGEVPPSMASLIRLRFLDLSHNNFSGKLSLDLSSWPQLHYLLLEQNKFSGGSPNTMQQDMLVIKLRSNQFSGNIPLQLCNLSFLRVLDLAGNKLSGSIPHCLYNIMHLKYYDEKTTVINLVSKGREYDYKDKFLLKVIDLSSNNLSGKIPKELFNLTQMWSLNLSRNHLTGKIPQEIGGVKNLESLDLSYNEFSGEIPSTISNLSFLDYLNLSYNNFIGQIPLGTQIQSFDSWSFVGNLELCGDPLPIKCNKAEETHDTRPAEGNEDDNFLKSLYLGMGVGFAAGFWGVCGSLFLIRAWRHKFFRWFDHLVDQIYVAVALWFKSSD